MRRLDLVNLASKLVSSFYAQALAVGAEEDSDAAAEGIVKNVERENGGDLCTEGWWLEDATQIDRSDLRGLVVDFLAERIRSLRQK